MQVEGGEGVSGENMECKGLLAGKMAVRQGWGAGWGAAHISPLATKRMLSSS